MTDGRSLLVRCDTSVAIGTGHAMRCLALAQGWQDAGGGAVFAMAQATPAVEERLQRESMGVARLKAEPGSAEDAKETVALAREKQASWVVVDGYLFTAEYQAALKSAGLKVLFIDDNGHAGRYSADLVLNQNAHANEAMYPSREASTRILLGPRYALLRREFAAWRGWEREIPAIARNVLVTMGGSDPDNFTRQAVDGLRAIKDESLRIRVLAGGNNPHLASLEELRTNVGNSIQLVRDATDMPEQMSWADLAVAGAGSACLEMCLMGLPALLVDLAENQTPIANEFARRGTAYHLGSSKTVEPDLVEAETRRLRASAAKRGAMSQRGRELVDGTGAERVVRELLIS
jgi:UDP-2,4-diacetamido-2,4,6-trideoxy-beta-L-altropyranose hydrolase